MAHMEVKQEIGLGAFDARWNGKRRVAVEIGGDVVYLTLKEAKKFSDLVQEVIKDIE